MGGISAIVGLGVAGLAGEPCSEDISLFFHTKASRFVDKHYFMITGRFLVCQISDGKGSIVCEIRGFCDQTFSEETFHIMWEFRRHSQIVYAYNKRNRPLRILRV